MNTMAGFLIGMLISFVVWLVLSAADRQASEYYKKCYNDLLNKNHQQKLLNDGLKERIENYKRMCKKCREGIEWDFRNE